MKQETVVITFSRELTEAEEKHVRETMRAYIEEGIPQADDLFARWQFKVKE